MGPTEFSRRTGLSAKALRLYADASILVPAGVDPANGYRSYHVDQLADARTIVMLRGAGVPLADVKRFINEPTDALLRTWERELGAESRQRRECLNEVRARYGWLRTVNGGLITPTIREVGDLEELACFFDVLGRLHAPQFDSSDARFADLGAAFPRDRALMLVAEVDGELAGGVLGFTNGNGATLRVIAVLPRYRRRGIGRTLVERFEAAATDLGTETIGLGTDEAVVFWFRLGYTTSLLLQWVFDPTLMRDEVARLEAELIGDLDHWPGEFNGVPQLFVQLDEPSLELRAAVREAVAGAHVGFCMFKHLQPA